VYVGEGNLKPAKIFKIDIITKQPSKKEEAYFRQDQQTITTHPT